MTNLILPRRRKLLVPSFAAGLAAASPAMGHNGGPPLATDDQVSQAVEMAKGAGIVAPWGTLPSDAALAMLMMVKAGVLLGGDSAAAALRPQDVFATTLYTGNGSTRTITTGLNMAVNGGLVWTKARSGTFAGDATFGKHDLVDTVRGQGKALSTNNTDAEAAFQNSVTGFSSTGYTLGTLTRVNEPSHDFASWSFRRAAKFFDVVTWTGNGVTGRQIAHSLGVEPGMMIVKRNDNTSDWSVYQRSLGGTQVAFLNKQDAAATGSAWNSTDPTSTHFTLTGGGTAVNLSGGTYVAYLFAHDADPSGIVQCGKIDSGTGSTIVLGWRPQYVMIKQSSGTGDWRIFDSARGIFSTADPFLSANTSSAETGSSDLIVTSSTGFTSAFGATDTWVHLAIREPV